MRRTPNASRASSSAATNAGVSFDAGGESPGTEPEGESPQAGIMGIPGLSDSKGWGSSLTADCRVRNALSSAFDRLWSWSIFFLSSSTSATACLYSAPCPSASSRTVNQERTHLVPLPPVINDPTRRDVHSGPTRPHRAENAPSGHNAAQPLLVQVSHGT